jgi:hypothetical protein
MKVEWNEPWEKEWLDYRLEESFFPAKRLVRMALVITCSTCGGQVMATWPCVHCGY